MTVSTTTGKITIDRQRNFYRILFSIAFSVNTNHKYNFFLRCMLRIFLIDWILNVVLATCVQIWTERNTLPLSLILERLQYILSGLLNTIISTVLILNKKSIVSTYDAIQTNFVQWSKIRGVDPNVAYEKSLKTFKNFMKFYPVIMCFISLGPFLSAIHDFEKIPLDSQTHFSLFWPKLINMNTFFKYALIYFMQVSTGSFLYVSIASTNIAFIVVLNELNAQLEILMSGLNGTFNSRTDSKFKIDFVECVRHHQTIIRFLNNFKSYFKWIVLGDIAMMQPVLAICVYNLTKVDGTIGYKVKLIGVLVFNLWPFIIHCYIGEEILNTHKRLAEHIYSTSWYEIPNKHKPLVVIMFQRTRKDMCLNSAWFFNETASRTLIFRIVKQVYTLLNFLLKT